MQFIADLNPLTAVAKIYAWLESNKDLYSGEEIKTVGQQVTVKAATTLFGRFARAYGEPGIKHFL